MRMTFTQRRVLGEIATLALLIVGLAVADGLDYLEMGRRDWVIVLGLWIVLSAVIFPHRTASSRPASSAQKVNDKVTGDT